MKGYLHAMFSDWLKYNNVEDIQIFLDYASRVFNRPQSEILECLKQEYNI